MSGKSSIGHITVPILNFLRTFGLSWKEGRQNKQFRWKI